MSNIDIKYQIFLSSTQKDLISEREIAIQTILKHYQFPIGMEMFNADNDAQWKVIRGTIDTSDLYILVIGHRYGSLTKKGQRQISYTQKEFEYALKKKIPILAFIRNRNHPVDPSTVDHENTEKLNAFINQVTTSNITVAFWATAEDLGLKISLAINKAVKKFEASDDNKAGWVKRSSFDSQPITHISLLENCNPVFALFEQTADKFETEIEDIEKHVYDEHCNCIIERIRTQTNQSDVTHSFSQSRSDKDGKSEILEISDISGHGVGAKLPYLICEQNGSLLKFCVLFKGILSRGTKIKYKIKFRMENFMSDLFDEGIGIFECTAMNNSRVKKREDIFIFPNTSRFENLTAKLIRVTNTDYRNENILPVINGQKKTFTINYGMINEPLDLRIEFKIN